MIATTLILVPALIFAPLLFGLDFNDMSFGAQILHSHTTGYRHFVLDHLSYKEEENQHQFIQFLVLKIEGSFP